MIGIIRGRAEEHVIQEFFELFKTPWEFYRSDREYDVVLCAGDSNLSGVVAGLIIVYAGEATVFDEEERIEVLSRRSQANLSYDGNLLPTYNDTITFTERSGSLLVEEGLGQTAAFVQRRADRIFARVGYDLFKEIQHLLTKGQPAANAGIPTLELHVAFLRGLVTGCGIPLVEVPPVPEGYSFIACLTHDLDHALLRRHGFDRTMLGFLYRATLGSAINTLRGRMSIWNLFTNWAAVAKVPFVHLGLAKDFWSEFDRYVEIENGKPSTFFVIPHEDYPGRTLEGMAPSSRACRYDVSHIAGKIPALVSAGCEIGLHGIDAWMDSSSGRTEAARIRAISGTSEVGVRMHWLYRNEESPKTLENAGFSYDSTVGYNETVGYRAGTSQVFRPLQATRMLELPLHVMDTALFYPDHLDLSPGEAWERLAPILDHANHLGGVVTINWHDRSIAPERLWGDFYIRMINELAARGAWFGTASQVVSWFQKRRSVVFKSEGREGTSVQVNAVDDDGIGLPNLRLRVHSPGKPSDAAGAITGMSASYEDTCFSRSVDIHHPKPAATLLPQN